RGLPQVDRHIENIEEGYKHGHLQDHRQTAADGIDLVVPVELDQLLIQLLAIIFVLLLKRKDLRLNHLHLLHRFITFILQRDEQHFDADRQEDDGNPIVVRVFVDEAQHVKDRLGDRLDHAPASENKPAEIDGVL